MRRAFSLLEVTIALSIFTMVMAAVLQSLVSVRMYANQDEMRSDLVLDGRRIIDTMVQDLGNSAWYVPLDCDGDGVLRSPFGGDVNDLDGLRSGTAAQDRALRYYPFIQVQTASGRGSQFAAWNPSTRTDVLNPASLPASLPAEHRLASQEVIFLKVRTAVAQASPAALRPARIDFNVVPQTIASYANARTGVIAPSLNIYAPVGNVISDIPLAWESHLASPDASGGAAYAANPRPDFLREWGYVVTTNPNNGKGRLVRRYRNGTGAVQNDVVLSEAVDRLVVDTYRTAPALNVNQVRITLYLSKAQDGRGYQTHRVQVTTALRSTVDPEYALNLGDWLGTEGGHTVQ